MESKSFGLSLLQCYSDDDGNSNSENDDEIKSRVNDFSDRSHATTDTQDSSIIKDKEIVESMVLDVPSISGSQFSAPSDTGQGSAVQFPHVNRESPKKSDSADTQDSSIIKDEEVTESMVLDLPSVSGSQFSASSDTAQGSAVQFPHVNRENKKKSDSADTQDSSIIKDEEVTESMVLDLLSVSGSQFSAHPDTASAVQFPLVYRESRKNSDSDSDSSSDESCLTVPVEVDLDASVEEDDNNGASTNKGSAANNCKSKMLEDLGIFDLAPLEDLKISVPEEECIPIGVVHKIIDPLVIVSAKKGCPAIDLDSALFLDHGKTFLGQVFDVFGQVSEPMYMVRFNSLQHIMEHGIEVGMEVYFAPRTRHTAFVFVDALFKQKGSDASWENDQEPPDGCVDYSDDEQERRAKAAHRLKKNPRNNAEEATANPSKKRQTKFHRTRGRDPASVHPQVNPFYMIPPPGYTPCYPPCYPPPDPSYSNLVHNVIPVAPVVSNIEQSLTPSPYVYPPTLPETQNPPITQPSVNAENQFSVQ